MSKFTAPYNFIPLEKFVFFPDWSSKVSQDIPFSDGEDGIIEVTLRNITPIHVGDGTKGTPSTPAASCRVNRDGKVEYFIPATTLKGCFRSVMEVLSFAKIGSHDNKSFGFREVGNPGSGYARRINNGVYCGWMRKNEDDTYVISPCSEGVQEIHHNDILAAFPHFKPSGKSEQKQKSLGFGDGSDELYPLYDNGKYRVVCTGSIKGKLHEYLFSEKCEPEVIIKEEVMNSFLSVHAQTEFFGSFNELRVEGKAFLYKRLEAGDEIPVFFQKDKNGSITAIGLTKMMRLPFKMDTDKCITNLTKDHLDKNRSDMPETIFGYVSGNDAMKGRVQFTPAFLDVDSSFIRFDGVLGEPKSSFYPAYLDQSIGRTSYDSETARISGRKRYKIVEGNRVIEAPRGNGNENVMEHLLMIPSGNSFTFKIAVHNLKKAEIGALLSAITFNGTSGCFHSLGKAKSCGYGKVVCDNIALREFAYSQEEYMLAFEQLISDAYERSMGKGLENSTSIQALIAMSQATHSPEEMKQLELGEFEQYKKKENINYPVEQKSVHAFMSDPKIMEKSARGEIDNLLTIIRDPDVSTEVLDKCSQDLRNLKSSLAAKGINSSFVDPAVDECNKAYDEAQKRDSEQKKRELEEMVEKARQAELKADEDRYKRPLTEFLAPIGNIGTLYGNLGKWMKANEKEFTQDIKEILVNKIKEMHPNAKDLNKKKKELAKHIGEEMADAVYSEL